MLRASTSLTLTDVNAALDSPVSVLICTLSHTVHRGGGGYRILQGRVSNTAERGTGGHSLRYASKARYGGGAISKSRHSYMHFPGILGHYKLHVSGALFLA